jgi:hypothetical protein
MITFHEAQRDWRFSEIEKRGLQFKLEGSDLLNYRTWRRRADEYKAKIRNISSEQTQEAITQAIMAVITT